MAAPIPAHPQTLLDKLWASHEVLPETPDTPAVLYVDLHLLHEISSPQGFVALDERGLAVRRPERTLAVMDHGTPTLAAHLYATPLIADEAIRAQLDLLRENCRRYGVRLLDTADADRGIVHVVGPELGLTHPGTLIGCGDSHTSTHGAFGALAFGIGSTELGHVLATQCLLQRKPRGLLVQVDGRLRTPATAKDLALAIIRELGAAGGTGCAIEYRGPGIEALSMEERMTVCNMSIEAGARSGLIAPDEVTFEYLRGRRHAPQGADWDRAVAHWWTLRSDEGAKFDRVVRIDASAVRPMLTWGTSPAQSVAIGETVPPPPDAATRAALDYMGLDAGRSMLGLPVHVVFLGSCTNGRLSDLRAAAAVLRGRHVAPGLRMLVVPGSQAIKRAAEAEGLDAVFRAAGAEWRESGCSMCNGINEDRVPAGAYCVSTSNRNFAGRQGVGSRTLLASPVVAAACALAGRVVDPGEVAA